MQELLTFDDVLIKPKFSELRSRSEVSLRGEIRHDGTFFDAYALPVVSANMDTVTSVEMAKAMLFHGGLACLHRFWSIEDNVAAFEQVKDYHGAPWVSFGLGAKEFDRAAVLYRAGARVFVLDVAHGAQAAVGEQYIRFKKNFPFSFVILGNFGNLRSVNELYLYMNERSGGTTAIDGIKVGIGPGSACTTRLQTGVGMPQLTAIMDMREPDEQFAGFEGLVIADGGCRTPGDVAKALAAGADLVMLGGMLAGTDETPGDILQAVHTVDNRLLPRMKRYRGSASKESYEAQGKDQGYITAEGESFTVPYKGPVREVLADIEGGLRSAFTYVGAKNIQEFHAKAEFLRITSAGVVEGTPHGKR